MDREKEIREKLYNYIKSHGVKQKWICNQIGMDTSLMCRFLKNKKELWPETLASIEQFLMKQERYI